MNCKTTLVIGFGSDILTDNGIGIHIVNDLQNTYKNLLVDFDTAPIATLEIIYRISGYNTLILIDGIKTFTHNAAGTLYHYNNINALSTLHIDNMHEASFVKMLETGKILGYAVPQNIHIIAIEVSEIHAFSENLSIALQQQYNSILNRIYNLIIEIIQ